MLMSEDPRATLHAAAVAADGESLLTVEEPWGTPLRVQARLWSIGPGEPLGDPVTLDIGTFPDATSGQRAAASGVAVTEQVLRTGARSFRVATIAYDATLKHAWCRLFDPGDGRTIADLAQFESPIAFWALPIRVQFSPDGRRLATLVGPVESFGGLAPAGPGPALTIRDAETGTPLPALETLGFPAEDLAFDALGSRLVVWGRAVLGLHPTGQPPPIGVRVLDATSGRAVGKTLSLPSIHPPALAPGGKRLVTFESDRQTGPVARVRSVDDDRILRTIPLGQSGYALSVASVGFSPDGGRVVIATGDVARAYALDHDTPALASYEHGAIISHVAVIGDGRRVITAGGDLRVRVWDAEGDPIGSPLGLTLPLDEVAMNPTATGLRVVAAQIKPQQPHQMWPAVPPAQAAPILTRRVVEPTWQATISPDGSLALLRGAGDTVRVWDVTRGEAVGPVLTHAGRVAQGAFAGNGPLAVTASADGLVRVWDLCPAAATVSPLGAHPDLSPGRVFAGLARLGQEIAGIGRQIEVLTLDLAPDPRPLDDLRDLSQLLGATAVEGASFATPDGAQLAYLAKTLSRKFPDEFHAPRAVRERWLNARAADEELTALWSAASGDLSALIGSRPRDWTLRARRGRALAARGEWASAAADYAEARRLAAAPALAWLDREAIAWGDAGESAPAVIALNEIISARPDDPDPIARRGRAMASLGQWKGAVADFAAAVARSDRGLVLLSELAAARIMAGDVDQYLEACKALVGRAGEAGVSPPTAEMVARVLLLHSGAPRAQVEAARGLLRGVIGAPTPSRRALATSSLAELRGGDAPAALRQLKRAEAIFALDPADLVTPLKPLVLAAAGNAQEARQALERASSPTGLVASPLAKTDTLLWIDKALYARVLDEARLTAAPAPPP